MEIPVTTKIKLAVALLLIALLAVFLLLNMETIEVNLIVGKIQIRRSVMIICTFVIGVFSGWVLKSLLTFRSKG